MSEIANLTTHRRGFLGRIAAGAAALGLGGLVAPLEAASQPRPPRALSANPEFEAWLNKITGKHKMLFDIPEPNGGFGFAWARVFLNTTNENYGTTDADNTVVIVLRHNGIPYQGINVLACQNRVDRGFFHDFALSELRRKWIRGVRQRPSRRRRRMQAVSAESPRGLSG